ncbi:tRNA (guanosine(37)-N1)-methyltransferase TrmD [Candidatus Endobugula sertula]|uniref:tRNA (guanine-N(1)-)-methyltransferase n=1 Tax=Candidatus Endobugula sertula TaxID=62101 RepID=A0A1D2QSD4_9GAMM|nr:tRNA (guanosine(37)-N1)-methyltransferase TrmD [Candidatus Endobugula sertula]
MRVAIVTLFPEMFSALTDYGISGRAFGNQLLGIATYSPRDFTCDRHQTVDDRPYGGGPGMVMKVEPLQEAIRSAKQWAGENGRPNRVIYLSPQGRVLKQSGVKELAQDAQVENFVLVAGRYEGIDERLLQQEIDEEWSIGDYVLSGGELPAMVLLDAIIRLLPGALGHESSAGEDSFSDGLLDCPHYTRPEVYGGKKVPSVLLSGNHGSIERWRLEQSLKRTLERRPDLLAAKLSNNELTQEQQKLLSALKK